MRIGLMVGSDKERPRADRLAGLVADGRAAEAHGFHVVLDTAGARLPRCHDRGRAARSGHREHRDRNGGRPHSDPPSDDHGAAGTDHAGRVLRPVHARHRPVAPLDHLRSARAALRATGAAGPGLRRRAGRGVRRSGRGGDRQSHLQRAQPGGRHRFIRDANASRRPRADDASDRRRAHRRHHPVDGRRARDRRLRGPAHHRGGERGRAAPEFASSQAFRSHSVRTARWTTPARTPARCSGMPTSPPTTFGCSSTATPKTSETPWPQATSPPSLPDCAATAMPVSPISPSGWFRSAMTPANEARRGDALRSSSRH